MIAATSIAMGLIAVQLRSVAAYTLIAMLIFIAFGAAALVSGGARWLLLAEAVLLFNFGIAADVFVLTLIETVRRRLARH